MPSTSLLDAKTVDAFLQEYNRLVTISEFVSLLNRIENELLYVGHKISPLSSHHIWNLAKTANQRYRSFSISKKGGGFREIEAPEGHLKRVQKAINTLFQILFREKINHHSNGFILDRNILRNARPHIGKRFLLNMDLENFFPSIEFRRVKTVLELSPFNLTNERERLAFLLANICCFSGRLPQGAPTSPILSNIVTQRLDRKLSKFSLNQGVKYSRYADDLSFSSNFCEFNDYTIAEITSIVESERFRINVEKTRVSSDRNHQEVTGLVVNEKINIRREYLKNVRTMLNNWEKGGKEYGENQFILHERDKRKSCFTDVVRGRIGYIGLVRGESDSHFQKLQSRFNWLYHRIDYNRISHPEVKKKLIQDNQKMERIYLSANADQESQFISFCTVAFHQIENMVNYYYWKQFPIFTNLLQFLLENNPAFYKRYKNLQMCNRFKKIKDLDINVLVYLIEKEMYFDLGISYQNEITMLRDIRNDDSHRCEVENINRENVIKEYNQMKSKGIKFKNKHGRNRQLNQNDKKIEYRETFARYYAN